MTNGSKRFCQNKIDTGILCEILNETWIHIKCNPMNIDWTSLSIEGFQKCVKSWYETIFKNRKYRTVK